MKKIAILVLVLFSAATFAQSKKYAEAPAVLKAPDAPEKEAYRPKKAESSSTTVFWSEDFSNGIPSSWTQIANPSSAQWEYRGPSTTPDNTVGSRGLYVGTRGPIASTSASNGFIIYDSGYLDNGGTAIGAGTAPAPHSGFLTTDTIDLSNEMSVELKMEMYARRFEGLWSVAISTDGGVSFPDTFTYTPESTLGVNEETPNGATVLGNISSIVGGQPYVQLRFVFDGVGLGYYFLMLDDIELRTAPTSQIYLSQGSDGAPARDMIYNNGNSARYGRMNTNQTVPVHFDGNVLNYGSTTQNNVSIDVEVINLTNASGNTMLSTPPCGSLPSGQICPWDTLNTPQWTPSVPGEYALVWHANSDSVSSLEILEGGLLVGDTIPFFYGNQYAFDRGIVNNYVGTNSADPELITMGLYFDFINEDPDSAGSGLVFIDGIEILMSSLTDSTGQLQIEMYDTTGYPGGSSPLVSKIFSLQNAVGTLATFMVEREDSIYNGSSWDPAWRPWAIPIGPKWLQLNLTPNATDGVIRMANDASFDQTGYRLMQLADGSWYSGFTSNTYEAPHVRLNIAPAPQADISLNERYIKDFNVYPNPTNGVVNLDFGINGYYNITVVDMVGNIVYSQTDFSDNLKQLDFSDVAAGVYLLNISSEHIKTSYKLTVQ